MPAQIEQNHRCDVVSSDEPPQDAESAFEKFWKAYARPQDRERSKRLFDDAVKQLGTQPEAIVEAAKLHAKKMRDSGTPRHFVNASITWLDQRMWEEFEITQPDSSFDVAQFYAERINDGKYIHPGSIEAQSLNDIIRLELVTRDKLAGLGLLEGLGQ